jgi:NAD(P)-dependent dehydrogenase (short-subunit alcohol dehydrogenase family)
MIAIDLSNRRALVTGANSGLGRAIAMNRPGEPDEIGRVAAFMVSLAGYMTGTTVAVDGGMLIYPDSTMVVEVAGARTRMFVCSC